VLDLDALQRAGVPAISVRDVVKMFKSSVRKGTRAEKKAGRIVTAVDGISFNVRPGEIFGLLGPNSCGKTTTLRCVSTLSAPDSGVVEVYGVDAATRPRLVRQMMSYVAQNAGLDKVLTGREHLELFAGLAHLDRATSRRNISELIEVLDLAEFIDRQAKFYSGGVARRLDLAIGLLQQPAVLVLDEPTVGLDAESRAVIWSILQTLRSNGAAILLTSHYLEEVDVLADSVAIMDHGTVLASGTVSDLKLALGGDRITVRISEFTAPDAAEIAARALVETGVATSASVNRLRSNSLELVVTRDDPRIGATVVDTLAGLGYDTLFGFSQSRPSLDDVYMEATGKRLEDADREAAGSRDAKAMRKEDQLY
jgi:ABC-2 type transport system ATP-binding protein